jgi:hypothetical protein
MSLDIYEIGKENKCELAADALGYFFLSDKEGNVFHGNGFYVYRHTDDRDISDDIYIDVSQFLLDDEFAISASINDEEDFAASNGVSNKDYIIVAMKSVEDIINNHLECIGVAA